MEGGWDYHSQSGFALFSATGLAQVACADESTSNISLSIAAHLVMTFISTNALIMRCCSCCCASSYCWGHGSVYVVEIHVVEIHVVKISAIFFSCEYHRSQRSHAGWMATHSEPAF